jgi:hypothetical protein
MAGGGITIIQDRSVDSDRERLHRMWYILNHELRDWKSNHKIERDPAERKLGESGSDGIRRRRGREPREREFSDSKSDGIRRELQAVELGEVMYDMMTSSTIVGKREKLKQMWTDLYELGPSEELLSILGRKGEVPRQPLQKSKPEALNEPGDALNKKLVEATEQEDLRSVQYYLDEGADIKTKTKVAKTPGGRLFGRELKGKETR